MSMSRKNVAKQIEQGNFNIFEMVTEEHYVDVMNAIADCYTDDFIRSSNPTRWIEFMRHLHASPPKFIRMPYLMFSIFESIMEIENRPIGINERCASFFMMMLTASEKTQRFNLNGNALVSMGAQILGDLRLHTATINLVGTMNEDDMKTAYGYFLDQYIQNPIRFYLLYYSRVVDNESDKFTENLFENLISASNDKEKLWFIETIKEIFEGTGRDDHRFEVGKICDYLRDTKDECKLPTGLGEAKANKCLKLKTICTQSKKVFAKVDEMIRRSSSPSEEALVRLEELKSSNDFEMILTFTNKLNKFLDGFGKLEYMEGLLISAQTASRKSYDYNPVVLDKGQLNEFLKLLVKADKPSQTRFTLTGSHWIAGVVEIDNDGYARVALFDSLGKGAGMLNRDTVNAMESISDVLPQAVIYFGADKRQNTLVGCSVYANDDMAHIFNIEKQMQKTLFDFFNEQNAPITQVMTNDGKRVSFHGCHLPLSLMRTAQTESYLNAVKLVHTQDVKVNAKGERFTESSERFFKSKGEEVAGRVNTRLEYELEKMARQSAVYMLTHDEQSITKAMNTFTLSAFKQKCEAIKSSAQVVEDDNPPLHRAIRDGKAAEAIALLKKGSDPYSKNPRNRSAMELAMHTRHLNKELASLLLMKAVTAGDELMTERLLQLGADPNNENVYEKFDEYPLHAAVRMENIALIDLLVANKARIDLENKEEFDPVEEALDNPKLTVLSRLLNGENKYIVNLINDLETIFEAQKTSDWGEVVQLLLCADHSINLDPRSKMLVASNVDRVFASFSSQLSEVSDEQEKIRLLTIASDPSKFLASIFSRQPNIVGRITAAITQEELMMKIKEIDKLLSSEEVGPRLE